MARNGTLALVLAAVAAMAAGCASNGAPGGKIDNSQQRKERILANLKQKFPSLAELDPTLGDIQAGPGNMHKVEMTIQTPRGEQKQTFLLTPDGKQLFMVIGEPIDVSKGVAELKQEKAKQRQEREAELAQLAAEHPTRGNPQAPVSIIEFSDFQCPYCKRAAATVEQVLDKYPDTVKVVFVNYPLPFHDWARQASIAAICAAEQDPKAFWTLHDAYFANQQEISKVNVVEKSTEYLADAGIDMSKWSTCATDEGSDAHKQAVQELEKSMAAGQKAGVQGTPAFFVDGEFLNGAVPLQEFERAIQAAQKKTGTTGEAQKPEQPAAPAE